VELTAHNGGSSNFVLGVYDSALNNGKRKKPKKGIIKNTTYGAVWCAW